MMDIKLFAIFSLLTLFPTFLKIKQRKDLSCIDIILLCQSLYMCFIPLFYNVDNITFTRVKKRIDVHIYIFLIYNAFAYLMILIDKILQRKYANTNSFFLITRYIRNWSLRHKMQYNYLPFIIFIIAIQWYLIYSSFTYSQEIGLGSMEYLREQRLENQSPITILLSGMSSLLRLYVVFILTIFYVQNKGQHQSIKEKFLLYGSILFEIILHFQISRTYLVESSILIVLIIYAINKGTLKIKNIINSSIVLILFIIIVFPIITGIRTAKRYLIQNNISVTNISDLLNYSIETLISNKINIEQVDNSQSRVWYVYQIIGYSYTVPYYGNGELTVNAISYGIPKFLFPQKSKDGSQGIIEKKTGLHEDIADSMLLLGVMENRFLGWIIAVFYYVLIIISYEKIRGLLYRFLKNDWCMPVILLALFIWLNRIEYSFDNFISSIIQASLCYIAFYYAVKLYNKVNLKLNH